MSPPPLAESLVKVWRRHNEIDLLLLRSLDAEGLAAVPLQGRGRNVARQFQHMNTVRLGWLHYHTTGKRPSLGDVKKPEPTRKELVEAFEESGRKVAGFLSAALAGDAKVRMFGGDAVRWLAYLITHEAHHRGQIALALKQNKMRLPEKVAMKGLWGTWIFGK